MRDFEDSTLWRISAFERTPGQAAAVSSVWKVRAFCPARSSPTCSVKNGYTDQLDPLRTGRSLHAPSRAGADLPAACRFGVAGDAVPGPHALSLATRRDERDRRCTGRSEAARRRAAGVRPPGHYNSDRVGHAHHYHELAPLLWAMALRGPRSQLLNEIGGTAAYRLLSGHLPSGRLSAAPLVRRWSALPLGAAARDGHLARHEPRTCQPPAQRAVPVLGATGQPRHAGGARAAAGRSAVARFVRHLQAASLRQPAKGFAPGGRRAGRLAQVACRRSRLRRPKRRVPHGSSLSRRPWTGRVGLPSSGRVCAGRGFFTRLRHRPQRRSRCVRRTTSGTSTATG